jgi:hypothetical protein
LLKEELRLLKDRLCWLDAAIFGCARRNNGLLKKFAPLTDEFSTASEKSVYLYSIS